MEHTYKIAGLLVNMDTFGYTVHRALPYQVEHTTEPDFTIVSEWKAFKEKFPNCTVPFCEYTSTAIDFYEKLLDYDGMLLHSSAVVLDGKAYMFTAYPGTGKSTHTALYRQVFGDARVRLLNDDKPAIRCENGEFVAYGTPWSGKTDLNLNLRAPIGGICVLQRGEKNEICRMPANKALHDILPQTVHPKDAKRMGKLFDFLERLLAEVPVWGMKCNMDPEAALVSYAAMSGEGKDECL